MIIPTVLVKKMLHRRSVALIDPCLFFDAFPSFFLSQIDTQTSFMGALIFVDLLFQICRSCVWSTLNITHLFVYVPLLRLKKWYYSLSSCSDCYAIVEIGGAFVRKVYS